MTLLLVTVMLLGRLLGALLSFSGIRLRPETLRRIERALARVLSRRHGVNITVLDDPNSISYRNALAVDYARADDDVGKRGT